MAITHRFVSAKPDGDDAAAVRPSDWNANHRFPPLFGARMGSGTPTNPTSELPINLATYSLRDMTKATQARIIVCLSQNSGNNGLRFRPLYNTNSGSWTPNTNWPANGFADLAAVGGSMDIVLSVPGPATIVGPWADIASAAKVANCFLVLGYLSGSGTGNVIFNQTWFQFR
jgi:hypothetical protein